MSIIVNDELILHRRVASSALSDSDDEPPDSDDKMDDDPDKQCPVCFEDFDDRGDGVMPDNALTCNNKHAICVDCVGRLAEPSRKCNAECMLTYKCPVCRIPSCISNFHLLVVTKRSWAKAKACFPCDCNAPKAEACFPCDCNAPSQRQVTPALLPIRRVRLPTETVDMVVTLPSLR